MEAKTVRWEDYKGEFEEEWGTLRDLYVFDTSLSDWQRVLDFLHSSSYRRAYIVDGVPADLPQHVYEIFQVRNETSTGLAVYLEKVQVNCHFFCDDEIEFDIDPREINDAHAAEAVFTFMRQIGEILEKEVVLTPENTPQEIIFRFQPSTETVEFFPALTKHAHTMRGRF